MKTNPTTSLLLLSGSGDLTLHWQIVNDSVMGGLSTSQAYEKDNSLIFTGHVSLENNGGFASIRTTINTNKENANLISLRLKGDGQTYQLRLRTSQFLDGPAYTTSFATLKNQWQVITFSADDFSLTYRGKALQQQATLHFNDIQQLGLMIAKKQQGNFKIELKQIAFTNKATAAD
ncbi:CIA30 family protein [Pseudoalteromonas prydzensis]|uniref:CIA30 family protein n=1 Tax=Pseudoalteromonas prydzensis TaxID=182141 RepID=A0ABR9FIC1_9GAMM|nr:CIA30 family protein [Pseudoalteromonas prydzensis]MBE0379623.1 hypothetical protein [Pseudoalteromonas prydzensis ACAM 620]MBE0456560.1 CIA30 family protein [Pseudoalteromonas prydzensis]